MSSEILLSAYELRPSVRIWQRHPGFAHGVIGVRSLADHEFVLITQSAGFYEDEDGRRPLRAGDLYLCRPGSPHGWHWGRHGTEHVFIHFDFDPACRRPAGPLRLAGLRPFPKVLHLGRRAPAARQMMRVADTTRPEQPWIRLIWRARLLELLALLAAGPLRPLPGESGPAPGGGGKRAIREWRVQRAMEYLEEHLADAQLSSGALARAARLSEPHFRRLCREVTGRSPIEIVRRRRLRRARQLLLDPRRQINEVARACGFSDPRYFARLFRKAEGLTPQAYRQSVLSPRATR